MERSDADAIPTVIYDHRDEQSRIDPWPRWREMRDAAPVLQSPLYDGFYVVPRYRDLVDVLRDTDTFSNEQGTGIPVLPSPRLPPLEVDPPQAREWRELVNPFFSPGKVATYRGWLAGLAKEMIDPYLAGSGFDVAHDVGIPLTRAVILKIMEVVDAPAELNQWTDDLVFGLGEQSKHGGEMLWNFLSGELAKKQERPGNDLISSLIGQSLPFAGRPLNDDEIIKLLFLILIAALETTNGAVSAMVRHLIETPEDAHRMAASPEIWPRAMDEFVRLASPAVCLARTTRKDAIVSGCPVPAGSKVMVLYGSANRDETEFVDPDRVILDRFPNRHLGFGMGPHRCLGSHLAKAQMTAILEVMLPNLHEWRVDHPNVRWNSGSTRGMSRLPIVRIDR